MYRPLSDRAVQEIHEGSLELLSQIGIEIANKEARNTFSRHGAEIVDNLRVIIPAQLVEDAIKHVTTEFRLYGRKQENNIHYHPGCFYTSTGGQPNMCSILTVRDDPPPAKICMISCRWSMNWHTLI